MDNHDTFFQDSLMNRKFKRTESICSTINL